MEVTSDRKYGRDLLLQLRLHPSSLQKPDNLRDHEIIKEKLYLHQINDHVGSLTCHPLSESDQSYVSAKSSETSYRYYRGFSECSTRASSSYSSGQKCGRAYQNNKSNAVYDCATPLRKCSFQSLSDYKFDLPSEDLFSYVGGFQNIPWSKYSCGYVPESWNGSSKPLEKASPDVAIKQKKTLAIIDPKNGKNILEAICKSMSSQESVDLVKNESENQSEKLSLNSKSEDAVENEKAHPLPSSNSDDAVRECEDTLLDAVSEEPSCSKVDDPKMGSNFSFATSAETLSSAPPASRKMTRKLLCSALSDVTSEDKEQNFECSNQGDSGIENMNNIDLHDWDYLRDANFNNYFEDSSSTSPMLESVIEEHLKRNRNVLNEQLCTIRQEQQKLSIVQSFLRFKKLQLDESYRNLDDKKLEIVNWECNLVNKARKLHEKECWLESRRLSLKSKEEKLEQRERMLKSDQHHGESTKIVRNAKPMREATHVVSIDGFEMSDRELMDDSKSKMSLKENTEIVYENGVKE